MTKRRRGQQRIITNPNTMMELIPGLQSTQNTNCIFRTWLINHNLLKATFESLVLLNVLSVFINRRCTNAPKFTPRQSRLQQVRRIHRSLCRTRTHDCVHLVNEQHNLPITVLHLLQHSLETLLKLPPHTRSSDERTHIQPNKPTRRLQQIRHIARHHSLRNSLRNRRLPHTRITNQHRIILRPSTQNLNRSSNFIVASNDRVEFALFGLFCEVNAVFVQSVVHVFGGAGGGRSASFADGLDGVEDVVVGFAKFCHGVDEEFVFFGQCEEESFSGNE
mmetsp:Transcript_1099/g.1640  ORF Transcript_1099/g.1640 Transcript_1099/m.1640 type:complete len:277 (-) Transcript_1099:539-1369(-)